MSPGATLETRGTDAGADTAAPPRKARLYSLVQVVVPLLCSRQVLTKASPGLKSVPSGTVISAQYSAKSPAGEPGAPGEGVKPTKGVAGLVGLGVKGLVGKGGRWGGRGGLGCPRSAGGQEQGGQQE